MWLGMGQGGEAAILGNLTGRQIFMLGNSVKWTVNTIEITKSGQGAGRTLHAYTLNPSFNPKYLKDQN